MVSLTPLAVAVMVAATPGQEPRAEDDAAPVRVHAGFALGGFGLLEPPAAAGEEGFRFGQAMRLELQLELFERLALALHLQGSAHRTGEYVPVGAAEPKGDYLTTFPSLNLRLNVVGFGSAPGLGPRVWLYLRGGAGVLKVWPTRLLPKGELTLLGALGVEYRTHLRRFSLGLEVAPVFVPGLESAGVGVFPNFQLVL